MRPISLGKSTIESKPLVKYHGLIKAAVNQANKAVAGVSALSRLMANIGSPTSSRLYNTEVRADALGKEVYRKRLTQVRRGRALQVAVAYRTISEPAVMVIAEVIPVALLAEERKPYASAREKSQVLALTSN